MTRASDAVIASTIGYKLGSIGVNFLTDTADTSAAVSSDFVCGANEDGFHLTGCNWQRDANLG